MDLRNRPTRQQQPLEALATVKASARLSAPAVVCALLLGGITTASSPAVAGGAQAVNAFSRDLYVPEGSIVMQLKGGQAVTLQPGQAFYVGPSDVHIVGRNASATKPARFVVVFVKDKETAAFTPVPLSLFDSIQRK